MVAARTGNIGRRPVQSGRVLEGSIIGLQGGTAEVRRKLGVVRGARGGRAGVDGVVAGPGRAAHHVVRRAFAVHAQRHLRVRLAAAGGG
ncbi:hypothetical protein A6A25_30840 [Saccharothrix sp. CB00851]|nr:hypothetical protein A6A25_30840 [Saccharothrix sp. CB00851]